jgi:hypothetical protein
MDSNGSSSATLGRGFNITPFINGFDFNNIFIFAMVKE